jgi:hypothetical protein
MANSTDRQKGFKDRPTERIFLYAFLSCLFVIGIRMAVVSTAAQPERLSSVNAQNLRPRPVNVGARPDPVQWAKRKARRVRDWIRSGR